MLVGPRDARGPEYSIQLRPFDADKSGAGLRLAAMAAMTGALLDRRTRGGAIVAGTLHLGGSLDRVPDPVAIAELAADKRASVLLMPAGARRELANLSDDVWTRLNIEFYSDGPDAVFKVLE